MTDEQKLERYEKMNIGYKPKFHKGKSVKDWWTCGQCGTTVFDGVTSNFCMNCGYRIRWNNPRCLTGTEEDDRESENLSGQMDITDFPEVMP